MNTKKKKGIFALMALIMVGIIVLTVKFVFFPSEAKEKTFQEQEYSIQLTEDFEKKDLKGATYYYESNTAIVMVVSENGKELSNIGVTKDSSLDDYMKAVVKNNKLPEKTKIHKQGEYRYITYESGDKKSGEFYFVAATYKKENQFWLINFACRQTDDLKFKKQFINWADSVRFK